MEGDQVRPKPEYRMKDGFLQANRHTRRVRKIQPLSGAAANPIPALNGLHGEFGLRDAGPALAQMARNGVPRLFRVGVRERDGDRCACDAVDVARGENGLLFVSDPGDRLNGFLQALPQEPEFCPFCQTERNVVTRLVPSAFHLLGDASRDPAWRFTSRNAKPNGPRCYVALIDALLRFRKQNEVIVEAAEGNAVRWPKRRWLRWRWIGRLRAQPHRCSTAASFKSFQLLRSTERPKLSRFLYVV